MKNRHIIFYIILFVLSFMIGVLFSHVIKDRDHVIVIEGHGTMSLTLRNSSIIYVNFVED